MAMRLAGAFWARVVAGLLALMLGSSPASGQPEASPGPDDLERARALFAEGKALFDGADYPAAAMKFERAYALSRLPLLLYNLGYTHEEMGKRARALYYYERYLVAGDLEGSVYRDAQSRARALRDAGVTPAAPGAEEKVALIHQPIERAPPGLAVDITVSIAGGATGGPGAIRATWQVTLYYRGESELRFTSAAMQPRYRDLAGRIPAAVTRSATVHYYVEARNERGEIAARSGRSTSPHVVIIDRRALPSHYSDLGDQLAAGAEDGWRMPAPVVSPVPEPLAAPGPSDGSRGALVIAKWSAIAGAVVFAGGFAGFYKAASDEAASLRDEADASLSECGTPPCRAFSEFQKDRERRGRRFEWLSRASLGLSLASAVAAGTLWYFDRRGARAGNTAGGAPVVAPMIGSGMVGGAAKWRF